MPTFEKLKTLTRLGNGRFIINRDMKRGRERERERDKKEELEGVKVAKEKMNRAWGEIKTFYLQTCNLPTMVQNKYCFLC